MGILNELQELCEPTAAITDAERLQGFIRIGKHVMQAFQIIDSACVSLNQHVETLIEIHSQEVKIFAREIEELKRENRILKRLDQEIDDVITKPMKMRTHYTGEFPYHGWKGVGRALEEALDQRDTYRATLEEIQDEFNNRLSNQQPDYSAIRAMVRGVLKMSHRKVDA